MNQEYSKITLAFATMIALLFPVLIGCGTNSGTNPNASVPPLAPGTELVFVGDTFGEIDSFSVDPNSGALNLVGTFPVSNASAGAVRLAADPSGTALYATSTGGGGPNVVAFTVAASTGGLTAVAANQTLSIAAGKIAVDPKGKNAYVIPDPLFANAAELFGFSIDPTTHGLTMLANQPITVPGVPHDVTVDPSGAFVYVTFQGTAGDEIAGFSRDPSTGLLTAMGSTFANTGGDSPQGIRVTPNGDFVIVANQATNNVSVLSLNTTSGVLTDVVGSPFVSGNGPGPVAIDPSGNVVLVGTGGLSVYTIGAGGVLTPVAGIPQSFNASSIAVDPSDKFVYVSNIPSEVSGFMLSPSTGTLTPIAGSPFPLSGGAPRDVIVIKP